MVLQTPSRSFSDPYEDDRFRPRFAMNIRHDVTMEIVRFHNETEAMIYQNALRKRGYKHITELEEK